jgi:hypothetical protein
MFESHGQQSEDYECCSCVDVRFENGGENLPGIHNIPLCT